MRIARPTQAVVLVVSALALGGCSSNQPPTSTGRTASLAISALADGFLYDCYEVWQDANGDGTPDTNTGFVSCDLTTDAETRAVPWAYSLRITVIRAGTTTEEVVTSIDGLPGSSVQPNDGIENFISLTDYDPITASAPAKNPADGLFFVNGLHVSVGNPVYQRSIFGIPPGDPRFAFPVGVPNILGATAHFDFNVSAGDTIVIRARKRPLAESPGFINAAVPALKISGTLSVGGAPVVPNGDPTSPEDDSGGFTFSYAVQ
jgi:hypothetical protein